MSPPLIAVDIGNSSKKLGWFSAAYNNTQSHSTIPEPIAVASCGPLEDWPAELVAALPPLAQWRVASVHREAERRLRAWVQEHRPADAYHCLTYTDLPIAVKVDFPDRVGLDRLAAAVAANALREAHRAAVVVDAGSALTVDLVSPQSEFLGGAILPGFRLAAQVLASATDQLPLTLLESSALPPPVLGKSTEAAIRSGLFWGAVGAVREIIAGYARDYPEPQVFVTGGDLLRLAPLVGRDSQFIPQLVLSGIALTNPPCSIDDKMSK